MGEEGVADTLKFTDVQQPSRDQSASIRTPTCIGCHSATPDSGFVAFVDNWPWNSLIAGVKPGIVGNQLSSLSVGGLAALQKPWGGASTFSSAVWPAGKRIMVTTSSEQNELLPWSTDDKQPAKLVWYNLDSPAPPTVQSVGANQQPIAQLAAGNYGIIARNGDPNGVAFPTWSHDGTNIIYSSTAGGNMDGRLQQGATDLVRGALQRRQRRRRQARAGRIRPSVGGVLRHLRARRLDGPLRSYCLGRRDVR